MEKDWPKYKSERLNVGNENCSTGLCTLWTPKEKVIEKISDKNYLITGQCYSKDEGISLIIRNVLANKKINYIVLAGVDMGHSGETLLALKEKGVDKDNIIKGTNVQIEKEIPKEAILRFIDNVEIIDKRDKTDFSELDEYLSTLPEKDAWGEEEVYERVPPKPPKNNPSETTGLISRGKYVGDVWIDILNKIMKFGYVKRSQFGDDQQELINFVSVITDEDPDDIEWKDYFQFSKEDFQEYLKQIMTAEVEEGVEYTYGSRLRDHKGINQVDKIIETLRKASYSRRAMGVTWNVEEDVDNSHSPCLILIQPLVQEKVHMTAFIRSNDMFGAWPRNALALRKVQKEIADALDIPMGNLNIISNSAHIYSPDWDKSRELIRENLEKVKSEQDPDPRGNVLIETEDGKIKITHLSPDGTRLEEFYANDGREAYEEINKKELISQTGHALDIGYELSKAEIALKQGLKYVQDKPLDKEE